MSDLTPKQARFVEEYLVDLNATQAAIRAGYSERTARSVGHENLTKPDITEAIQAARAALSQRTEITQDRVLTELARIGFCSLSQVTNWGVKEVAFGYDSDGRKLPPEQIGEAALVRYVDAPFVTPIDRDDLPEDVRAAVAEVALTKDGFRIKMHDKAGALAQIGRHLGMFVDKHEHTGAGGGPIRVAPTIEDLARLTPEERASLRAMAEKLQGR